MANISAAAENADQLRRRANRRLLGASVLLLVAIILVPFFLEREPPPLPDNVDVKIPPIDGTKFDPKLPDRKGAQTEVPSITEPIGAPPAAPAGAATAAPVAPAASTQPSAVPPNPAGALAPLKQEATKKETATIPQVGGASAPNAAQKVAPAASPLKASEKPAEKAAEKTAAKPAVKSGQLVVQLVAVRDPASAKQVFEKARALKVPAYTEQLVVSNGTVTRVRVGPYDDKKSAEAARAKLAKAGFEAKVITLP
jgi:DedD protein